MKYSQCLFRNLEAKTEESSNKLMSMFNYFWKTPLIKISNKEEMLDPLELGDSALASKDEWERGFSLYDNALLSGSKMTGDSLMSKEKELLDKYKDEFASHDHSHHWCTEEEAPEEVWTGDNWEYIWGCWEFEEDWVAWDINGDVIDRYHCVHFHKNKQGRFKHFKKAKKVIKNWKSYKAIVRQLKKIKKLKNLLS